MKLISAEMKAHIEGEVSTLASCWKIVRQDGQKFFYTEHDAPITYGGDIYKATGGFNKSAISSNATFSVDEMEVSGFLEDAGIRDEEMRNGAFDFAKVEVFAVNYNDLSMGIIKLRSGWFGEIRTSDTGAFLVELRGLVDMLGTKIGMTYLPECSRDLGDDKCGIDLYARRHQAGKVYKVGQRVRYPVADPDLFNGRHYPQTIDPNIPGIWNANNCVEEDINMIPWEGPKVLRFTGEVGSGLGASETATVPDTAMEITAPEKASSLWQVTVTGRYYAYYRDSVPHIILRQMNGFFQINFVDAGLAVKRPGRTWYPFKISIPLSASMTETAITLGCKSLTDSQPSVCFDALDMYIEPIADTQKDYRWFGNREFVCINAGKTATTTPTFNTGLLATTNDGGVVWEAHRPKYVMLANVAEDATNSNHCVIDTADIGVGKPENYFDWGVVTFLSGDNVGRSVEAIRYNEDTGNIRFALPIPYQAKAGDILTFTAGCDKRFSTCKTRFENGINFRGFPRMPGEGQYFKVAGM